MSTTITGTYYVHESELGDGATESDARRFARVARRYFAHLGHEVDVVVGVGLDDDGLTEIGNRAFDAWCTENCDVVATCVRLGC